jgi:PAS domain S-box-containing protein
MDITDRKRTEEELRASEERFRTVADFAYAWEYWVSPKGELRYVSPSVERITGRSRQEFMENPKIILDLIHPEDREQCGKEFFASLDADDVHKSEFRIVLADGSIRWIGHVCQAVYSKTGEYLGRRASNDDITEKKIAAEALAKAVEAAENANRVKSMFIANLSHEIRTPMNAIIGFTDLVLSTHLTEDQRKCLGMVKARGEDLLVIIGDILDISRIEAGKTQLAEDRINLKELVRDLARSFHHEAMKKSLSMAAKVSDEIPPDLIGDPVRIRQVLVNLLGNALKFTQRGSILLSLVCVEPPSPDGFCTLLFTISDTGIGIPKEKQAAIFDAFTQADSSTVRKFGGTGLGLAICSKLVAMMSGRIWVESETGKGSNFLFTIRLRVPAKATPGEAGRRLPEKASSTLREQRSERWRGASRRPPTARRAAGRR